MQFSSRDLEMFAARVDRRHVFECWPWTGAFVGKHRLRRYGAIRLGDTMFRAHRLAWQFANEMPVPDGKMVCHACDHPWCVNPRHLWIGTNRENMADMIAKGRQSDKCIRPLPTHCRVCGHHRTDDVREGGDSKCRPCLRARQNAAARRRRAARKLQS